MADDLGRKAVAGVRRSGGWRHPGPIAGPLTCGQPIACQLDGAEPRKRGRISGPGGSATPTGSPARPTEVARSHTCSGPGPPVPTTDAGEVRVAGHAAGE